MNVWKLSTIALTLGMALLIGKDAFTRANAAPASFHEPSAVHWDWGSRAAAHGKGPERICAQHAIRSRSPPRTKVAGELSR